MGVGVVLKNSFLLVVICLMLFPYTVLSQKYFNEEPDTVLSRTTYLYLKNYEYDSLHFILVEAGVNAEMNGNYIQSFGYLHLALKIAEWQGNISALSRSYINIGIIWFDIGNSEKAISCYNKALLLARKGQDTLMEIKAINNIGNVYLTRKNDADTALLFFSKAYELSEKTGYIPGIHAIGGNIAQIYLLQGKYDEAENLLNHLLQSDSTVSYYYFIAAMIDKHRLHYSAALENCSRAMQLTTEPEFILAIHNEQSEISFKMGDFEHAYEYLLQKSIIGDSIHSLSMKKHVAEMEEKYENEKRLLDIARLENTILTDQKKDQRVKFLVLMLAFILILLTSYLYFFRRNARNKMKLIQAETESKTAISFIEGEEAERKRLANELHDGLVGSITGLRLQLYTKQMKAKDKEADTISSVILELDALATETRTISHKLFPVVLEKFGLREALKKQFLPFTGRDESINFTLQFFGENYRYDLLTEKLVFHIIQELFGNIVKHAQTKEASLKLTTGREIISCMVTDKGIGFDVSEFGNGQGLYSVRERLERIGGLLDIESEKGKGSILRWSIPAKYINTGSV